jgi:AcrR family transcriptional regulator
MRHVARTLNTTAGALYWHVGSKDGLLDLIFDRVIGEQLYADRVLAILRAGGIPGELAVVAHQSLISIVLGFGIDETGEGATASRISAPWPSTTARAMPTPGSSSCSTSTSTASPSAPSRAVRGEPTRKALPSQRLSTSNLYRIRGPHEALIRPA